MRLSHVTPTLGKDSFFKITNIRTDNYLGQLVCALDRVKSNQYAGNQAYPMHYFTSNQGKTDHGEWFFAVSDTFARIVCEKCQGSFVLTPGEAYRSTCNDCI